MAGAIGSQFDFYQKIRVNDAGAMLVDISGTTIDATIDVQLTHSGATPDSVRIGDGNSEWKLNNGAGIISGTTILGNETGVVDMVKGALRTSGTTILGDENNTVGIVSGHLKVSGLTQISNSSGSEVVGITNKYLLVSGNTIIANETGYVDILSNNSLKISGSTTLSDGTNSGKIFSDGTILIGGTGTKPQITFTSSAATVYSIGDILNSGDTTNMEQFTVLQSTDNAKSSWCIGGKATRSGTGTTSIDLHLFSSGFTLNGSDKDRFNPNINELEFYIGTISYPNWITIGTRAVADGIVESPILLKPVENLSDIIYGVLVLRNNYSRPSSEVFSFSLDLDLN